jgi:hypothetical protein
MFRSQSRFFLDTRSGTKLQRKVQANKSHDLYVNKYRFVRVDEGNSVRFNWLDRFDRDETKYKRNG